MNRIMSIIMREKREQSECIINQASCDLVQRQGTAHPTLSAEVLNNLISSMPAMLQEAQ